MMYVFAALGLAAGLWSLTISMGLLLHVLALAVCAVPFWAADVMIKTLVACRYCDRGRSWDVAGQHYGEYCPGAAFGLWSCGGVGKKLRWELKVLRLVGIGTKIRDPVRRR